MKQSLELPHLRHSLLLEAKENKKPKASVAVSGGRRRVSCLKRKNPIAEILRIIAVVNSKCLVFILFLKTQ